MLINLFSGVPWWPSKPQYSQQREGGAPIGLVWVGGWGWGGRGGGGARCTLSLKPARMCSSPGHPCHITPPRGNAAGWRWEHLALAHRQHLSIADAGCLPHPPELGCFGEQGSQDLQERAQIGSKKAQQSVT